MKKILFLFLLIPMLMITGCKKKDKSFNDSTGIEITYKNAKGQDLLNATTPNYFSADNIHLYNVVNGVKKEVNYPNYDIPHNFVVVLNHSTHVYFLRVFLETDTTLLQLNRNITDTITAEFTRNINATIVTKVLYNEKLEWDDMSVPRAFTIVK